MIAVIDYGVGNLFSLCASLKHLGIESVVTRDKQRISECEKIILPGVGAFGDAADKLHECDLFEFLQKQAAAGKDFLGICLGMQLLFEKSSEYGEHSGLGLIHGQVVDMRLDIPDSAKLKIPHMGWNSLHFTKPIDPLLTAAGINEGDFVYFVHSFYAKDCDQNISAYSEYYVKVPAVVRKDNVIGMQFHPEKSSKTGLALLKAFAKGKGQ